MPLKPIADAIPKGTIAGALMFWKVPPLIAELVEAVVLGILRDDEPERAAQRAAAVVAARAASDAIIDEALKSTNVMRDETKG